MSDAVEIHACAICFQDGDTAKLVLVMGPTEQEAFGLACSQMPIGAVLVGKTAMHMVMDLSTVQPLPQSTTTNSEDDDA